MKTFTDSKVIVKAEERTPSFSGVAYVSPKERWMDGTSEDVNTLCLGQQRLALNRGLQNV